MKIQRKLWPSSSPSASVNHHFFRPRWVLSLRASFLPSQSILFAACYRARALFIDLISLILMPLRGNTGCSSMLANSLAHYLVFLCVSLSCHSISSSHLLSQLLVRTEVRKHHHNSDNKNLSITNNSLLLWDGWCFISVIKMYSIQALIGNECFFNYRSRLMIFNSTYPWWFLLNFIFSSYFFKSRLIPRNEKATFGSFWVNMIIFYNFLTISSVLYLSRLFRKCNRLLKLNNKSSCCFYF